jgi:hypothetical protein
VEWGDGASDTITASSQKTHTFTSGGAYTLTITGTLIGWSFGAGNGDQNKLLEVVQWGTMRFGNNGYQLNGASVMSITAIDSPDLTGTTNMQFMFAAVMNGNLLIRHWDVSKVTNMKGMFYFAFRFNEPIGVWDVSSVTNMDGMFEDAPAFLQDISSWCVSRIPTMPADFDTSTSPSWTTAKKPVWGTCP